MQYSRWGFTRADYGSTIPSLAAATPLSVQPRIFFAFWATRAHYCLMSSFSSTGALPSHWVHHAISLHPFTRCLLLPWTSLWFLTADGLCVTSQRCSAVPLTPAGPLLSSAKVPALIQFPQFLFFYCHNRSPSLCPPGSKIVVRCSLYEIKSS